MLEKNEEEQRMVANSSTVLHSFDTCCCDRCADISNVLKPFDDAAEWAVRITDEFFSQVAIMIHFWLSAVAAAASRAIILY